MKTIEASFEIVTPMFISGGDNEADLRPPSIKGALRFWWRALHWGQCLKENQQDTAKALKNLHQQEASLFGAAVKDKNYGQGVFAVKLTDIINRGEELNWPVHSINNAGYIAYGIDATTGDPRKGIPPKPRRKGLLPTKFKLTLILKKGITSEQKRQLKDTLLAWGLLGGLGARARRGYGSVAITQIDEKAIQFKQASSYFKEIQQLLKGTVLVPEIPIFTAFNEAVKISALVGKNTDYKRLMDVLGNEYKTLRTEKIPENDLDKAVCGLPLTGDRVRGDKYTKSRRSSPIMLHVHKIGADYVGLFSFMPAEFHPLHKQDKILPLYKKIERHLETSPQLESIYP